MADVGEDGGGGKIPEISVVDPFKHGEGVNTYMSYSVVTKGAEGEPDKNSIRRFSDFEWLHTRLCSVHRGIVVPPLPDKNVVEKFRFSPDFIEGRRRALEKFVRRVAQHPVLRDTPELRNFLEDDEDTWSRQTMVAADVRGGVFGKKSSDYMSMFKEMQWGLSSMVLGRATTAPAAPSVHSGGSSAGAQNGLRAQAAGPGSAPSPSDNDKLKAYAEELDQKFSDAHKHAAMFVKKQKETASCLASLGAALVALGQAESAAGQEPGAGERRGLQQGQQLEESQEGRAGEGAEGQGAEKQSKALMMGRAFVDVGKQCEDAAALITQQTAAYVERVEDSLKEYVRMALSLKRVVGEHSAAVREERLLDTELQMKKTKLEKLKATPAMGAMDRLRELEGEVTDAQNKATAATSQREKVRQSMVEDIRRFHRVMLADMRELMSNLKELHSELAQKSAQCWREGLPLLRKAEAALALLRSSEVDGALGGAALPEQGQSAQSSQA